MSTKTFHSLINGWNKRLFAIMNSMGITQTELSKEIGRSAATINQYFRAENPSLPPLDTFAKICNILRVSTDFILFGENPINPKTSQLIHLINELKETIEMEGGLKSEQIIKINTAIENKPELHNIIDVIIEINATDIPEKIGEILKNKLDKKSINALGLELLKLEDTE